MPFSRATPYLTVHDGNAALEFYAAAFGAVEMMRVVMDEATGQLGHAEFRIGDTAFFLSDEFAEMGVVSPHTLGGTAMAIHLDVDDVDSVFDAAVAAGADAFSPPADQPHGARHGMVIDPFGHRWMISQQIEEVGLADYETRMHKLGAVVTGTPELTRPELTPDPKEASGPRSTMPMRKRAFASWSTCSASRLTSLCPARIPPSSSTASFVGPKAELCKPAPPTAPATCSPNVRSGPRVSTSLPGTRWPSTSAASPRGPKW